MRDHFGNNLLSSDLNFAKGIHILDDCEGTFTWQVSGTDANVAGTYDTAAAWTGTNGIKLLSGGDSPAENDFAQVYKAFGLSQSGLLVARCKISTPDITKVKKFGIQLQISNGTATFWFNIMYYPNTSKMYYLNSAGAEVEMTEFQFGITNLSYITMELVIDTLAMQYISCYFSGIEKSLAGIDGQNIGASTAKLSTANIKGFAAGANEFTLYVDNIYVGEYMNI